MTEPISLGLIDEAVFGEIIPPRTQPVRLSSFYGVPGYRFPASGPISFSDFLASVLDALGAWSRDLSTESAMLSPGRLFHFSDFESGGGEDVVDTVVGNTELSSGRVYFEIEAYGYGYGNELLSAGITQSGLAGQPAVPPGDAAEPGYQGRDLLGARIPAFDPSGVSGIGTVMCAIDFDAGLVWFGGDGLWRNADGSWPNTFVYNEEFDGYDGKFLWVPPGPDNPGAPLAIVGPVRPYLHGYKSRIAMHSQHQRWAPPPGFRPAGDPPSEAELGDVFVRAKARMRNAEFEPLRLYGSSFNDKFNEGGGEDVDNPLCELIQDTPLSPTETNLFSFDCGPVRFISNNNPETILRLALDANFGVGPHEFAFEGGVSPDFINVGGALPNPPVSISLNESEQLFSSEPNPGMLRVTLNISSSSTDGARPEQFGVQLVSGHFDAVIRVTDSMGDFRVVTIRIAVGANSDRYGQIPSQMRYVAPKKLAASEASPNEGDTYTYRHWRIRQVPWLDRYNTDPEDPPVDPPLTAAPWATGLSIAPTLDVGALAAELGRVVSPIVQAEYGSSSINLEGYDHLVRYDPVGSDYGNADRFDYQPCHLTIADEGTFAGGPLPYRLLSVSASAYVVVTSEEIIPLEETGVTVEQSGSILAVRSLRPKITDLVPDTTLIRDVSALVQVVTGNADTTQTATINLSFFYSRVPLPVWATAAFSESRFSSGFYEVDTGSFSEKKAAAVLSDPQPVNPYRFDTSLGVHRVELQIPFGAIFAGQNYTSTLELENQISGAEMQVEEAFQAVTVDGIRLSAQVIGLHGTNSLRVEFFGASQAGLFGGRLDRAIAYKDRQVTMDVPVNITQAGGSSQLLLRFVVRVTPGSAFHAPDIRYLSPVQSFPGGSIPAHINPPFGPVPAIVFDRCYLRVVEESAATRPGDPHFLGHGGALINVNSIRAESLAAETSGFRSYYLNAGDYVQVSTRTYPGSPSTVAGVIAPEGEPPFPPEVLPTGVFAMAIRPIVNPNFGRPPFVVQVQVTSAPDPLVSLHDDMLVFRYLHSEAYDADGYDNQALAGQHQLSFVVSVTDADGNTAQRVESIVFDIEAKGYGANTP